MTYFEGFIVPVPEANREAYLKHATDFAPMFREMGIERVVETWDSDVPEGKLTDFRKAVAAKPEEKVVFSWFEYPSKDVRTATTEKMMSDPRMEEMSKDVPFDAKRMIYGGFEAIVEEGEPGGRYADGFVVPLPDGNREQYREMASKMAKLFREFGASRVVESISEDVPHGKVTDYYRAVQAKDDEKVVFSFIEWPDKATRDQGWRKIMADERAQPDHANMPFDGKRMFWGGFDKILDTANTPARADA
jgi:uncharacterized protein YbaA (DUF1428 family)